MEWYFDELLWSDAQPGKNTRSIDEIKKLRSQGESRIGAKAYAKVFATGWLAGYGCLTGNILHLSRSVFAAASFSDFAARIFQGNLNWNIPFVDSFEFKNSETLGLVGPNDYIVIDSLGHNCLKEGVKASQAKLRLFEHLSTEDFEQKLKDIREKD